MTRQEPLMADSTHDTDSGEVAADLRAALALAAVDVTETAE